jgi:hypothetical protein
VSSQPTDYNPLVVTTFHSEPNHVCVVDVDELKRFGERGRNRTFNLLIKSQLLCQLSYAPINGLRRLA